MLAMILVLPLAVDWLRRRTYETFLVFHILFSVVALVGCF
jgi:ferric-chelate reductase